MRVSLPTVGVLAGLGAGAVAAWRLSHRFGVDPARAAVALPGDDLVPDASVQADRGIVIDASTEDVWPWLTQVGRDRAGFYSWTVLENAVGCEITDVHELRPEWSGRAVGDVVELAPGFGLRVAESVPGVALVLSSDGATVPDDMQTASMDFGFSWAFVLTDLDGMTLLHLRERYAPHTPAASAVCRAVLPVSALMTSRMLQTIKRLAESP